MLIGEDINLPVLCRKRAERIYAKIQNKGPQQVRLYGRWVLSFRYPTPRGYGTRGIFVGIYTKDTEIAWIESDLLSLTTEQMLSENTPLMIG